MMTDKDTLRATYGRIRTAIPHEALAIAANDATERLGLFLATRPSIKTIACYLSYRHELPTDPVIKLCIDADIRITVPAWDGEKYRFTYMTDKSVLVDGPKGIKQPSPPEYVDAEEIDMFIVPGLVFCTDGGRIGYGGGWYDRLLAPRRPDSICAGYCLNEQISLERLPLEPHDRNMDVIFTPKHIYRVMKNV